MAAPVKPSDFLQVVVQPEDTLAEGIVKTYVRLPPLLWKLMDFMFDSSGNFTPEFQAMLCDSGCGQTPST